MKTISLALIFLAIVSCKTQNTQNSKVQETNEKRLSISTPPVITLLSETPNLAHAESVFYDPIYDRLYVSVQGEQEPGDGSIATLDLQGNVLDLTFTTGLDNPKGIAIKNDAIYVSDVTKLVAIDRKSGKIKQEYSLGDEQFLNDVAVDDQGNVYVSDMRSSSIYRLSPNRVYARWMTSPLLENPNGLLAVNNQLYVAAWGLPSKVEGEKSSGRFLKVDPYSKKVTNITASPQGNLDGVQLFDESHFLISDWSAGTIHKASKDGGFEDFFTSEFSVGDILYIQDKQLMVLPLNRQNKVQIYSVR
ncbi:NHL repeat-containing protein [Nonlabens ponticola]|uniref:Gluconolaconase n=1 Tax=Nonlabens ponticola TaxID=2496866 RepID=A0A3S9MYS2_9FLAO|nr:hypothetical protein [Nonlabens ponticola]AZQ44299.1 hypothetical protein EJ995_08645 [Nonlabens ponticola]